MPRPPASDPAVVELLVSRRLAALREEAGLTLAELARRCGLSGAYLSRVENHKTAITLANLARVATALGVPMTALFEEAPAARPIVVCRHGEGKRARFRGREAIRLRLPADAKKGKLMEPLLCEIDPARPPGPLLAHRGEEFLLVLEGRCRLAFDKEEIILGPGDCVYFDSSVPHAARAHDAAPCRFVSVVSSPDYRHHGDLARVLED